MGRFLPKKYKSGMSTSQEKTPPAKMMPAVLRTDNVAHAQILAGGVGLDGCALEYVCQGRSRADTPACRARRRRDSRSGKRVERAQAEAEKDAAGRRAAAGAGLDHVGAGRAFGILQDAVLLDDERTAQRHHEQHAEIAADQRQHEDAEVFEVEAEKDERRQREDDARGDGLAGVARGLDDDAFQAPTAWPLSRSKLMEMTAMGMEAATVSPALAGPHRR